MNPRELIRYERVHDHLGDDPAHVIVTQEPVWSLQLKRGEGGDPAGLIIARSLDEAVLDGQVGRLGDVARVVGAGGGTAIDAAKYIAWKKEASLVLAPTALTVDAPFTHAVAIRREGRIDYMADIVPERIVIDLDLIRKAPAGLNRGGVGDLLSIHTALYDWKLAHERTGESYSEEIARQSAGVLTRLNDAADDVKNVTERGARLIVDLFCEEVELCERHGNSRPEEGSEHHILYTLECFLGGTLLHGPAVTLCTLLGAHLQGNDPERIKDLADRCGVNRAPSSLVVTREELETALLGAREYALADGLPYTFLHEVDITPSLAREAVEWATSR